MELSHSTGASSVLPPSATVCAHNPHTRTPNIPFNVVHNNSSDWPGPLAMHNSPQRETGELPVGELLAERRLGPSLQRRTRRRPEESTPPNLHCPPNPSEIPDDARRTRGAQHDHILHPTIPVPTPFKYAEVDTDDFRGFFDFNQAWLGAAADVPSAMARARLGSPRSLNSGAFGSAQEESAYMGSEYEGSGHIRAESSPDLCLLSPPYSSGSSGSSGIYSILTPHTPYSPYVPYQDQEEYDLMYKLDLGAESPYLGSAYAEAYSSKVLLEHLPRPTPGSPSPDPSTATDDKGKRSSTDSAHSDYRNTHCGICLSKAVSPCRTRCCEKLFCLGHLKDWLQSEGSSSLCPSCDAICVLPPECLEDKDKDTATQKSGSASSQRSRSTSCDSTASASSASLAPASSTSFASFASSASSASSAPSAQPSPSSSISVSDSSTACTYHTTTTTNTSSNANLVWSSTGEDGETEDVWDVKATWKKNGGGSLDAVEMVRDVLAELTGFIGLSGGRSGKSSTGMEGESRKMKRLGGFGTFGSIGSVMEVVRDVEEIGEVGWDKRVMSIVGLVLVLFVLFR